MAFPQLRSGWGGNPLAAPEGPALNHYTITADPGSFSWTGTDSSLEAGWKVAADPGAFTWNGTDASLEAGWVVTADGGAFTWTGTDASFVYVAEGSSPQQLFARVKQQNYPRAFHPGHSKPFRQNSPSSATMAADPGAFSWTGSDASTFYGRLLTAASGGFTWAGTDASFTRGAQADALNLGSGLVKGRSYPRAFHPAHQKPFRQSGLVNSYSLSADVGAYSWTGVDANLFSTPVATGTAVPFHFKTHTWPRPFAPNKHGQLRNVPTLANLLINPTGANFGTTGEAGTYLWTGADAALVIARKVAADSGTYSWTGTVATLNYGKTITLESGTYVWVGTAADLAATVTMVADAGEYLWTGTSATLSTAGRFITADPGSYSWTGTAVTFPTARHLDVDVGEYIWLVADANLMWSAQPQGGAAKMLLLGVG